MWFLECNVSERPLQLMAHPTHVTLKEWQDDAVAKTVTASDRVDDFVRPWMTRARCMEVTFEELGVIPRPFIKLDRILQEAIKAILNKKDEV